MHIISQSISTNTVTLPGILWCIYSLPCAASRSQWQDRKEKSLAFNSASVSVKMCSMQQLLVLITIIGNFLPHLSRGFCHFYFWNLLETIIFCRICWSDHSNNPGEICQCYNGWKHPAQLYVCFYCGHNYQPHHPVGIYFIVLYDSTAGTHTHSHTPAQIAPTVITEYS